MSGQPLVAVKDPPSQQDKACVCQGRRKERGLLTNHPGFLLTKAQTDHPTNTHKDQKTALQHQKHVQNSLISLNHLNQSLHKKHSTVLSAQSLIHGLAIILHTLSHIKTHQSATHTIIRS